MDNLSEQNTKVLSAKDWAITIFISGIPLVGIIMLLIWAFSDDTNLNKKNWAKGSLLIFLIAMVIGIMFMFLFGGLAMIGSMSNN